MTTPAINRVSRQYVTGTKVQYYSDGSKPVTTNVSGIYAIEVKEQRPASTNHRMSSSGWRDPGAYYHSYSYSTPYPQANFGVSSSNNWKLAHVDYYDGAGWTSSVFSVPGFPTWLKGSAVNKALLALKNQHVNLAVAFAEREEVGELAIEAANRTVELIRRFQNRHRLTKKQVLSMTARSLKKRNTKPLLDDFLQVQYGVRPLMQDVYGSCDALNKRERDADAYRATVRGRSRDKRTQNFHKMSNYTGNVYFDVPMNLDFSVYVRLDYVLDNPLLATLASLGITNPAELVWERIPFSFVLDWFIPVGNYLSAWDAALGWKFKAGTISSVVRVDGSATLSTKNSPGVYTRPYGNGSYTQRGIDFQREVLSSSPTPWIPSFKNPLSGQHVANAIALAASRLR